MSKHIVINSCSDCPHKEHQNHSGAFGQVSYVPVCRKVGHSLGYTVSVNPELNMGVIATYDRKIPTWCPLPDGE